MMNHDKCTAATGTPYMKQLQQNYIHLVVAALGSYLHTHIAACKERLCTVCISAMYYPRVDSLPFMYVGPTEDKVGLATQG